MKILYLVRHAKSSWDDPSLEDFDRPLNKRGKSDASKMGKRLKKLRIMPDLVVSSPAKRAAKTAQKIAKEIDYPVKKITFKDALYHASSSELLRVIQHTSASVNNLMLFGHNPGLTDFANGLCEDEIDNIVTTGIYALQFEVEDWQQIKLNKKGELLFYDYPKKE